METIYVHLNARKIGSSAMACGGETAPSGECYAILPRPASSRPAGACKVLDFAAYRRKTEAECPAAAQTRASAGSAEPAVRSRRRADRLGLLLDLCATAAILAVAVIASVRFLGVL